MKNKIKDFLIIILGWTFLLLGIAGLFLPVLQGILFLLIGLYLLSKKSPWAKKILIKLKHRFPKLAKIQHEAQKKAKDYLKVFRLQKK